MAWFEETFGGDLARSVDRGFFSEGIEGFLDPLGLVKAGNDYMNPDNSKEIAAQQAALQNQLLTAANQVNLKDMQSSQAASQAYTQKAPTNSPNFLMNANSRSQSNDFLGL
jgi:hypothetical protein